MEGKQNLTCPYRHTLIHRQAAVGERICVPEVEHPPAPGWSVSLSPQMMTVKHVLITMCVMLAHLRQYFRGQCWQIGGQLLHYLPTCSAILRQ